MGTLCLKFPGNGHKKVGGGGTIWREFLFTENEAKKADKKSRKNVREREEGDEEYL